MRTTASFVFACTVFVLAACATPPPAEPPIAPPASVITGGYGSADLADESVKAAQSVAVEAIYTRNPTRALVEKATADVQVVAGLNYRFNITMTGGAAYRVVVYRDLQGKMSVTAYEKLG
jgi:hypothetical protein